MSSEATQSHTNYNNNDTLAAACLRFRRFISCMLQWRETAVALQMLTPQLAMLEQR